ncbi:MAG: LysR family transcriptional regulator, partial [Aeromonas veronii]
MLRANLNLLPTLKVLLETRNISRAAELLHLSQPSISKQLAQLRSEFDDELLVREGQRWLLTPRAELLAAQLADSLSALERLYEAPGFDPSRCERVFRLASSDYVAQHILPDICAALAKEAPLAALEYSLWDKRQLPQLWQSELDLVSTITEQVPEQIRGLHQGEDRLAVLMGRHHPLAGKALSLDDYLAWPHLQVSGGGDKDSPVEQV